MKKQQDAHISFKSIFYTLRVYRAAVGKRVIFFVFYQIFTAVTPSISAILSGNIVTAITKAVDTHDIMPTLWLVFALLVLQLVSNALSSIDNLLSSHKYEDAFIYVRERISTKYLQIPLAIRESRDFADRFSRVESFASSISSVASELFRVISTVVGFFSTLIATLTVSPIITLVIIISTLPSSILTVKLSSSHRRNWREYTRDRRMSWRIEGKLLDSDSALEIEMNGLGEYLIKRMVSFGRRSQAQDIQDGHKYLWPRFGADALETITSTGVLTFVAIKIIQGQLAIGQFLTIRTLLSQLNTNVSNLFGDISFISERLINATDFMEFMETPTKPNGHIEVQGVPTIEFKGVSFSYPNSNTKVLDNISFKIEPGESLAIVGENGAGKTTIIKLLIGAYSPSEGAILINGHPFSEIERNSYLSHLGTLFQEYSRYDFATLGENVRFGDISKKYSTEAVEEALEKADLSGFPSRYEKGLDQIMSKDFDKNSTVDLSGGQWQRLAIARTLYRAPDVLILDEPTSAIDAKSENKIFRNIFTAQKGKTTIIISHRFSTIRKATHIIVLDHGKIIESGAHEELVAKQNGVYKTLFEAQAKGYR